jgi:hypothetical protein
VNTYALFAEHFSRLARRTQKGDTATQSSLSNSIADTGGMHEAPTGRAGIIVPTGIATDSSTSAFFGDLVANKRLTALFDFENREGLFPGVHPGYRFSALVMGPSNLAHFAFLMFNTGMLDEKERRFTLSPEQISVINPNTKTAPVFRSRADADLTAKLYSKAPVLIKERPENPEGDKNPWGINFSTMFHMSGDSGHFRGSDDLQKIGFSRSGIDWEHSDGRRYVPLYEAKMIHHYDHRWATYEGEEEELGTRDVTIAEKQNSSFEPSPRYWVPEDEVDIRASRVPVRLKSAFKKGDAEDCLKVIAEWVLGSTPGLNPQNSVASLRDIQEHLASVLGPQATSFSVVGRSLQNWLSASAPRGVEMQRFTPLHQEDLAFINDYGGCWLGLAGDLIERKKPKWLMGIRGITKGTQERTIIGGFFPKSGVGHSAHIWDVPSSISAKQGAALIANMSSIPLDYIARQKVGGTNLNFFHVQQFPFIDPNQYDENEFDFICQRVLELVFTSESMRPLATQLGHSGQPFSFAPDRRLHLRSELDAFFARKYGLNRDELRFVLDPAAVKGETYPSETFSVIKRRELAEFGEYRTQRLVLEAFDRMTGS